MNVDRARRVARGLSLAVFSTFMAVLAHSLGGGHVPGVLALVVTLMFSVLVSIAIAGKQRTFAAVSASVLLSQGALHVFYSLSSPASMTTDTGTHAHHAPLPTIEAAATSAMAYTPLMVFTHLGAAALTIVLIRRADIGAALVALAAALIVRPAVRVWRHGVTVVRPLAHRTATCAFERPLFNLCDSSAVRYRGPPLALAGF